MQHLLLLPINIYGDTTLSREDIEVTKRLAEAGKILGIDVLDPVIVIYTGKNVSLKKKVIHKNRKASKEALSLYLNG